MSEALNNVALAPLFPNYPLWACTTLQRLKDAQACAEGYRAFSRHLKEHFPFVGKDDPVPLAIALQSNSFDDVLWGLRNATCEPAARQLRELACDFAEHVLEIFEKRYPEDKRPRQCIEVARRFARGEATDEERRQARAAYADAAYADYAAAYADYAADYAAYAAYAAYARLAERQWQSDRLAAVLRGESGATTSTEVALLSTTEPAEGCL